MISSQERLSLSAQTRCQGNSPCVLTATNPEIVVESSSYT